MAKDGYIDVDGEDINIGKTEEWAAFVRRNPEFMKRKGSKIMAICDRHGFRSPCTWPGFAV